MTMFAHVERKHWWIQFPFSWGVEAVLVLVLLAGTAVAAIQVRGQEATIANQAVTLAVMRAQQGETLSRLNATVTQLNATVTQQDEFRAQLEQGLAAQRRVAEVDGAIVVAYGQLQAQRAAMQQALRGEYGEVYESYEVAAAGAARMERQIALLLAERSVGLTKPATSYR